MCLFGILKIALGVPAGTEGFRFGAEMHVEIHALLQVSRTPVEKMLTGFHWALGRGRGEERCEGVLWGGLEGLMLFCSAK